MVDGPKVGQTAIDPEGILRSALEKIVFFECRVSSSNPSSRPRA